MGWQGGVQAFWSMDDPVAARELARLRQHVPGVLAGGGGAAAAARSQPLPLARTTGKLNTSQPLPGAQPTESAGSSPASTSPAERVSALADDQQA